MATTANRTRNRTDIKDKVRALLDQAEHENTSEEEAQAFAAKAAELMLKHGLDEAVVRATKKQRPETVKRLDITISGQGWHGKARAHLIYVVAEAYGCQAVTFNNKFSGEDRIVSIVGTTTALDTLTMLLPSVLLQAETNGGRKTKEHMAMVGDSITDRSKRNGERRDFYRSYLRGYGQGVAAKIRAARTDLADSVTDKPGALVLVSEAERINEQFTKLFPKVKTGRHDGVNAAGYVTGQRDGQQADTGGAKVAAKARRQVRSAK